MDNFMHSIRFSGRLSIKSSSGNKHANTHTQTRNVVSIFVACSVVYRGKRRVAPSALRVARKLIWPMHRWKGSHRSRSINLGRLVSNTQTLLASAINSCCPLQLSSGLGLCSFVYSSLQACENMCFAQFVCVCV